MTVPHWAGQHTERNSVVCSQGNLQQYQIIIF